VAILEVMKRLFGSGAKDLWQTSFFQEKPAQSAKVVEYSAAGDDVPSQFGHVVEDKLKCFFAAVGAIVACEGYVRFHFRKSDLDGFTQQRDIFVGTVDIVKRSLGAVAHLRMSSKVEYAGEHWGGRLRLHCSATSV